MGDCGGDSACSVSNEGDLLTSGCVEAIIGSVEERVGESTDSLAILAFRTRVRGRSKGDVRVGRKSMSAENPL